MSVGLGLPFCDPAQLLTWAHRADAAPFSTVALPHRSAPGAPEPLLALAALAGTTSRIRLQTELPLTPPHRAPLLARQAATLDALAGTRLTLGIGIGDTGPGTGAGGRADEELAALRGIRSGGATVLFGGAGPAVGERVARYGDGFLSSALPSPHLDRLFRDVEAAWSHAGRTGQPRLSAQVNVALGPPSTLDRARRELRAHAAPAAGSARPTDGADATGAAIGSSGSMGSADHIVNGLLTSRDQIRDAVAGCMALGADEVLLCCWSPDPDQVGRIADAVFPPDGDWPGLTDD